MPVREMTDAEAEEFFGNGLIVFGAGLREQYEASLKRKKPATPAKPVAKNAASARKPGAARKAARKVL